MSTLAVMPTYIRTYEELKVTQIAVDTLKETAPGVKLVIVDDGSPDKEAVGLLQTFNADEIITKKENEGFARTVNVGLKMALNHGHDALLVNADMEFHKDGWFEALDSNPADVVGGLLLYPNGLVQHAGIYFSIVMRVFDHIYRCAPETLEVVHHPRECPVTGALQLIRHETLKEVGLYDKNFRLGWEDVAYCHDVFISGRKCAYEPTAIAIHHESLFRGRNANKKIAQWTLESWKYLHKKFAGHSFNEYIPSMMFSDEFV